MSFLQSPVSRIHAGDTGAGSGRRGPQRTLRKSQSHGGFLNPLVRLARHPRTAIEELWSASDVTNQTLEEEHTASRERESQKQVLYLKLKKAQSYEEWRSIACDIDRIEGNDAWKEEDESSEYDYILVKTRLKQLDEARVNCDTKRMLFLIRTALTRGLGGMGDLRLYKHSHVGTKTLIERYIESTQKTITALLDISASRKEDELNLRHLLDQMLQARQSFGRSALLLSGGGTFGMNHIGVVKTLWAAHLLPRIVSGASAGSIVAAVLCAKTDEELPAVLDEFCYGELDVFERDGEDDGILKKLSRFLKHGSIFDISNLVRVVRNLIGDLTFQEAYNRTRRILNIPVSTASMYELPRLLNYITAPNVIIWSAVAASCSVPLVFSAAALLAKDPKTGKEVPWNPSPGRWIDGSVDNDLPMTRLAELFNVNHFIVSQVNPHVVPFVNDEGSQSYTSSVLSGPGWLNSMANLAKDEALHRMHVLAELGVFPNYLTKARSVLSQRYAGDVNIFPDIDLAQVPQVLSNPSTDFMEAAMLGGEKATWPKMSRIQNHCAIELALDEAVGQLRARVAFSPSQVDLRQTLHGYTRPVSQGNDRVRKRLISRQSHQHFRFGQDGTLPTLSTTTVPKLAKPSPRKHQANQSARRQTTLPPLSSPDVFSSSHDDDDDDDEDCETSTFSDASDASASSTESPPSPRPLSTGPLFASASQPATPFSSRVFGSPLAMTKGPPPQSPVASTSASPSAAELRYKRLFHLGASTLESAVDTADYATAASRPGSRRNSGVSPSASAMQLDISGTRGMMHRRKKSGSGSGVTGLGML